MAIIVCDVHERRSTVPARLRGLGVSVEMTALGVGDYAIGRTVVVERTRVDDLQRIGDPRTLLGADRSPAASVPDPHLLVEGPDLDDGPLSPQAVRGCLVTAADLGVRLLRSTDAADSALWLHRLAIRHGERPPRRDRPLFTQRPRSAPAPAEAVLAAVPGISHRSATALLERFGTLRAVVDAGPEQWTEVKGIGAVRAKALADALVAKHVRAHH